MAGGWSKVPTSANLVPRDVMSAMEELGIESLREAGNEIHGKCPVHMKNVGKEDRHPSFSVNADTGLWGCYSCGGKGRFTTLVSEVLNISPAKAEQWVFNRGGAEHVLDDLLDEAEPSVPKAKRITESSLSGYPYPPANRLADRGLSAASARHYGVLWDPDADGWVIPIRDPETGALMGWQTKSERKFKNVPFGIKKGHTLFGLEKASGATLIVVESPLDVLRLYTAGYDNGVATYGASLTSEQVDLIYSNANKVIWALDNDPAGTASMSAIVNANMGIPVVQCIADYRKAPSCKDIGEMSKKQIYQVIEDAVPAMFTGRVVPW